MLEPDQQKRTQYCLYTVMDKPILHLCTPTENILSSHFFMFSGGDRKRLTWIGFLRRLAKAVVRRCFSEWVFLKLLQYSKENTWVGISLRLQLKCFLFNIAKFLRRVFFTEHLRWLLLDCHTFTMKLFCANN